MELLTCHEVAQELLVHPQAVYDAISRGALACVKAYGKKLVAREALEEYKQRSRVGGRWRKRRRAEIDSRII
jgi:predicted DNA-binding protein YlxM (UPF0122 family)